MMNPTSLCTPIESFNEYCSDSRLTPLFLLGGAQRLLDSLPAESIDLRRDDLASVLGPTRRCRRRNRTWRRLGRDTSLVSPGVFAKVKRVLKPTGSFWLNIGDAYVNKNLIGLPWRVALALTDEQGWILRNGVVWNKVKGGMDNSTDKLRNVHEMIFHFVKQAEGLFLQC